MGKGAEGPETLYTKDFLLLSTSTGLFFGGLQLLIPAIPLYVERMGGSRFEVGLAVGTLVVSALLFRPAVGSQTDRRGGKRFLALGCLVAVFASLGYIPASSLLPLLFFRILHGLGVASFTTAAATSTYGTILAFLPLIAQERGIPRYGLSSLILRVPVGRLSDRLGGSLGSAYPALIAWVVEANPPERRGAVLSIFTTFFELGLAFGSIILGLVGEAFGLQTMFLLSGLLALGGLILFWQSPGGRPS